MHPGRHAVGLVFVLVLAGCASPPADPSSREGPEGGALCPPPCEMPVDVGPDREFEPSAAVDPLDGSHLLVASTRWMGAGEWSGPGKLKWYVSFDGGASFEGGVFPGDVLPTHPLFAHGMWADPNVLILEDGAALFVGMAGEGVRTETSTPADFAFIAFDVFAARSEDGGRTWPTATIVADGEMPAAAPMNTLQDQPFVAAGRGAFSQRVVLVWAEVVTTPTGVTHSQMASVSIDGGRSWGEPVLVMEGGKVRNGRPAVGPDGTLYMTLRDRTESDERSRVLLAVSKDVGATWDLRPIEGVHARLEAPMAATSGALHAAIPELVGKEDGPMRVLLLTSHDEGITWETRVLDELSRQSYSQPCMTSDAAGNVHVSWLRPMDDAAHELVLATLPMGGGDAVYRTLNRTAIGSNELEGVLAWPVLGDYRGMSATDDGRLLVSWVSGDAPATDLRMTWVDG